MVYIIFLNVTFVSCKIALDGKINYKRFREKQGKSIH